MSKTAPQIEAEIRAALNKVRGPARGLYHEMRYIVENLCDARPGELRQGNSPVTQETLANLAGYSPVKVPALLLKLQAPDVQLIDANGEGNALRLPHVRRIADKLAEDARRKSEERSRKGVQKAKGVTSHPERCDISGLSKPCPEQVPPDGSLSHSLSLSPSPSSLGEAVEKAFVKSGVGDPGATAPTPDAVPTQAEPAEVVDPAAGDELDARIKALYATATWLGLWDRSSHAKFRSLAIIVPWERAVELVREGVAAGKVFPVGWALSKAKGLASETRPAGPQPKPASKRPNVQIFGEV